MLLLPVLVVLNLADRGDCDIRTGCVFSLLIEVLVTSALVGLYFPASGACEIRTACVVPC